jgi:hypothetical protein
MVSLVSILKRSVPPAAADRRKDRLAAIFFSATGVVLGLLQAQRVAKLPSGYIAGYSYAIAFLIAVFLCALGLPLLIHWRTRRIGFGLILVGIFSLVCFYSGIAIMLKADRIAWEHETMRSLGPTQRASAVIYFCPGITNEQIEDFRQNVLEVPYKSGADRRFPSYVRSYFRLAPSQAHGYEGIALNFDMNAAPQEIKDYYGRLDSDPHVMKLFVDRVPNLIQKDETTTANGRCRQTTTQE